MKATVANPDAWGRLIGPQNIAPIRIDGEETMVLLDGVAQISSISKKWVEQAGLPIYELENLVDILQAGGSCLDYEGYTEVTITSDEIPGLNYTFPVLIVPYTEYHDYVPLTLGTKTLYYLHDSGILDTEERLPTSWNYARKDIELKRKLEGQPEKPLGFAKNQKAVKIGPSQTKTFHCLAKAQTYGMTVNVIVEPMEESQLPPGLECQYSYSEIQAGSSKIAVSIRNHSQKVLKIPKGVKIGQIFTANQVPKILNNAIKVTKLKKDIKNSATKLSTTNPMKEKVDSSPSQTGDWLLEKLDLSGMSKWPPDLQAKAKALLLSYSDIFSKDEMDLGKTDLVKHHIALTNYTPVKDKYRRIPPHLYEEVRSHLKEMLDLGGIRKSQSPWSSPIVLVRKKDGKLRFCIDLRKLNQRTVRDNYSLPKVEHMLKQLIGSEWFCTLDLKSGYWQVELTEESKPYTAFTCGPLGFFECDKMPFGAANTPATFQRLMENCLGSLNLTWCVVYLDDIIVYGKDPEDLLLRLGGVFEKLRKAGLKLKPSKCNFFKEEIEFLGHVVSKEGIATNPSKVQSIQDWPIPKTVYDIKSFTSFVGYYRKFIPNFSKIVRPLNDLLNGKVNSKRANKKQLIEWGSKQQKAFDTLKEALMSTPVLGYPNYEKPFILHTDASLEGLGAVLYQEDDKGIKRVISYASRSLSKSEKNYPAHKLEFLALKWAVSEKFKDYLYGGKFEVFTDNNPLTYILTSAKLDATTQRWIAGLASFHFSLSYKSGKSNTEVDALSRIKWPDAINEHISNMHLWVKIPEEIVLSCFQGVLFPNGSIEAIARTVVIPKPVYDLRFTSKDELSPYMSRDMWYMEQKKDPQLLELKNLLSTGYWKNQKKEKILQKYPLVEPFLHNIKQFWLRKDDLLYRKVSTNFQGAQTCLWQLLLPQQLVKKVLEGCHDQCGHLGRDRTLSLLRERFYWPNLYKDCLEHLESCRPCKLRKARAPHQPLKPLSASRPMELVHLDYLCLEPCKGNLENVLVVTDHFTRYAQAFPTKTQTPQTKAKVLWDNYICHYGFPEKIISDQGRNFESDLIKEFCNLAKVKKLRTTPYHPLTNGQCERFNRTLCDMLGTLETEEKANWKAFIHTLTHAYNATRNSSTGYSPFFLMFGRHPRLPVDVAFGIHRAGNGVTFSKSKYVDRLQRCLAHAYKTAKTFTDKESSRQKALFDKRSKDLRLEPGDLCLVKKTASKARHKIQNRWEDDLYVILSQTNEDIPVYTIRNTDTSVEKTLHRNLLLPLGYSLHVQIPDEEEEQIFIEPILPLVEEIEAQSSEAEASAEGAQSSMRLDPPDSNQTSLKEVDVHEASTTSGVTSGVSTKFGGTDSGASPEVSTNVDTASKDSTLSKVEATPSSLWALNKSQDLPELSSEERKEPSVSTTTSTKVEPISNGDLFTEVTEPLTSPTDDSLNKTRPSSSELAESSENTGSQEPEESVESDDSETASSEEDDLAPILRRSSRTTKGAPPTRYGKAFTHQLGSFEFNL